MKYHYYPEYPDGGTPIIQLPKGLELVTVFLFDVEWPLGRTYFLKEIERVLRGEISFSEVSTETCELQIRPDFTTITDIIVDPDDDGPQQSCVIETVELRDLLLARLELKTKERMKYCYHIEFMVFGLPIMRLPQEIRLVSLFLFSEVQDPLGSNFHLQQINQVLQEEVPSAEVRGAIYSLLIKKDFTTVIDTGAEDGYNSQNSCVIETVELRKLLVIWLELKRLLYAQQQAKLAAKRSTDPELTVPTLTAPKPTFEQHQEPTLQGALA